MRWRAGVIVLAAVAALVPVPARVVERYYSGSIFPVWQRAATAASNLVPFAAVDLLLVGAAIWTLFAIRRLLAEQRRVGAARAIPAFLLRTAAAAAIVYLAFLASWGWNYRRQPMIEKVRYDPSAVSSEAARRLAASSVAEVNALHDAAHASAAAAVDASLASSFAEAQRALGAAHLALPGRPKWTILNVYFRAAGVDGMTDPFFLETLVAAEVLPFERPFVVAHEWSHLAGYADEGEANFLGWLTCTKGSEAARYSAWLFLYAQVAAALDDRDRAELARALAPGPRADLRAIADRIRRDVSPVVSGAGWRVYDRYLKANRVEAGTQSYAEVVRLVLGIRLET